MTNINEMLFTLESFNYSMSRYLNTVYHHI